MLEAHLKTFQSALRLHEEGEEAFSVQLRVGHGNHIPIRPPEDNNYLKKKNKKKNLFTRVKSKHVTVLLPHSIAIHELVGSSLRGLGGIPNHMDAARHGW